MEHRQVQNIGQCTPPTIPGLLGIGLVTAWGPGCFAVMVMIGKSYAEGGHVVCIGCAYIQRITSYSPDR